MAAANPFKKIENVPYREWEESLLLFLLDQLSNPNVKDWREMAADKESTRRAAFMAYQLANVARCRRLPAESVLRGVYRELTGAEMRLSDFQEWLNENWISPSRFVGALDSALRQGLGKESRLVAA